MPTSPSHETHYACTARMKNEGGKVTCCQCDKHWTCEFDEKDMPIQEKKSERWEKVERELAYVATYASIQRREELLRFLKNLFQMTTTIRKESPRFKLSIGEVITEEKLQELEKFIAELNTYYSPNNDQKP